MTHEQPGPLVRGSVLVVDDSAIVRRELCHCLEQAGFKVATAAEGVEGLWRARQATFDLVLTDVHMPTMDGLEFVSELRRLSGYDTTPVFVLTSDRSKERLVRGREVGATAWVIKPPNLPALMEAVRQAVEGRRAAPIPTKK